MPRKSHLSQTFKHFCKTHPFLSLLITIIIFFRILLPIRGGQFGPDESFFALRAYQFFHCVHSPEQMVIDPQKRQVIQDLTQPCGELPLKGLVGRLGFFYGPYISYILTILYGLTQFQFFFLFLLTSVLFLMPPLLLAFSLNRVNKHVANRETVWTFLLAITSPLAVKFSLEALWDTPYLMIFATLFVFIFFLTISDKIKLPFFGLILGTSLASHIQALPFILGSTLYIFTHIREKRITRIFLFVFFFLLPLFPYLLSLFFARNSLSFRFRVVGQENVLPNIVLLLSGIFRFFGMDYPLPALSDWLNVSYFLSITFLTICIRLSIFLLTILFLWRSYQKKENISPIISLIAHIIVFYLPLSLITNLSSHPQEYMMTWWFFPVIAPIVLYHSFRRKIANILLGIFLVLNILTIILQYTPRLIKGTQLVYPHGPSWWVLQQTSRDLCEIAQTYRNTFGEPLFVTISQSPPEKNYHTYSFISMIAIRHPDCVSNIRFNERKNDSQYLILPDKNGLRFTLREIRNSLKE
ncbi:hypothetical protein HYW55_05150 [Candidatus Gottesmanbacteria bacterium]|nr:hypothetical protein [Candidatus Gottesmanbacteria bacterium]